MKKIVNHLKDEWYKYFLEILVLIIGIYGAFALENWSEEMKIKKRTEKLLFALRDEHIENRKQLERGVAMHELVEKTSFELIRLIHENEEAIDDTLRMLVGKASWVFTFDPINSTLNSAITSGDIHFIDNELLKNELLSWIDQSKDAQEEEIIARDYFYNEMYPIMHQFIMESDILHFYHHSLPTSSRYKSDYKSLVYTRGFENIITARYEQTLETLKEMRPIYAKNKLILELIDQSLEKI